MNTIYTKAKEDLVKACLNETGRYEAATGEKDLAIKMYCEVNDIDVLYCYKRLEDLYNAVWTDYIVEDNCNDIFFDWYQRKYESVLRASL